ncbi:hypothetical protein DFH07DRAFT_310257 [Mycena maculata]|uniref:WW domain-containing protein n=1 Tax=Mycena maculata TaxID=230809 RepID=A0AAD7HFL2_9AGAR|nr:hypothetical protein DFH07DRAFT_310257 [Mycena maculata]
MPYTHKQLLSILATTGKVSTRIMSLIIATVRTVYRMALRLWLLYRGSKPLRAVVSVVDPGGPDTSFGPHVSPHSAICSAADATVTPPTPVLPSEAPSEPEIINQVGSIDPQIPSTLSSVDSSPFSPTAPELLSRYARRKTLTKSDGITVLGPLTTSFTRDVPDNWMAKVNPEGALYYVSNSTSLNIFTDAALHEKHALETVLAFVRQIEEFRSTNSIPPDPRVEPVLDFVPEKMDALLADTILQTTTSELSSGTILSTWIFYLVATRFTVLTPHNTSNLNSKHSTGD